MKLRQLVAVFAVLLICLFSAPTFAGAYLSSNQKETLSLAHEIALNEGLNPRTVKAIALKESKAGDMPGYKIGGREFKLSTKDLYYGIMQIKLSTALDVLRFNPSLKAEYGVSQNTPSKIINLLQNDKEFNITIGAKYLNILREIYGYRSEDSMILAWNRGPGGARNYNPSRHWYVLGIKEILQSKLV